MVPRTNTLALVSMIIGIVSFVFVPPLSSAIAVLLGYLARNEIRKTNEAGGSMALAGVITGYVSGAYGILIIVLYVIFLSSRAVLLALTS